MNTFCLTTSSINSCIGGPLLVLIVIAIIVLPTIALVKLSPDQIAKLMMVRLVRRKR